MTKKYSDEDILRYLYNEMNEDESLTFLEVLGQDDKLWSRFEAFRELAEKLEELQYQPSIHSENRILLLARLEALRNGGRKN